MRWLHHDKVVNWIVGNHGSASAHKLYGISFDLNTNYKYDIPDIYLFYKWLKPQHVAQLWAIYLQDINK